MAKSFSYLIIGLLISVTSLAQEIQWKNLEDVSFEETYLKKYDDWFLVPTFGNEVKKLSGTEISIKGYMVPIDLDGKIYALSAYPYSSCFFCGGAGPESVMTLLFNDTPPRKYEIDEVCTFKGILNLNPDNPEEFIYVLKNVKDVTP